MTCLGINHDLHHRIPWIHKPNLQFLQEGQENLYAPTPEINSWAVMVARVL